MSERFRGSLQEVFSQSKLEASNFGGTDLTKLEGRLQREKLIEKNIDQKNWILVQLGTEYLLISSDQFQKEILGVLKKE